MSPSCGIDQQKNPRHLISPNRFRQCQNALFSYIHLFNKSKFIWYSLLTLSEQLVKRVKKKLASLLAIMYLSLYRSNIFVLALLLKKLNYVREICNTVWTKSLLLQDLYIPHVQAL